MKVIITTKFQTTKFQIWLWVNVLLPIIVPLGFAGLATIMVHLDKPFAKKAEDIWIGGAYIFLCLFMILSLLPHFFDTPRPKINLSVVYCCITAVVLLFTYSLYINFLELIENGKSLSDNLLLSIGAVIFCTVITSKLKMRLLPQRKAKINRENFTESD